MAFTRRSLLYGTASVALAAVPLPALPAAPLSVPKAETSLLLESLLAASAIESWSRNRSATWWKVDQLYEDIVQLQLAENGYDYAMPRPGDPPNFPRFSRFMQLWEGLPLGKQVPSFSRPSRGASKPRARPIRPLPIFSSRSTATPPATGMKTNWNGHCAPCATWRAEVIQNEYL
ncbi:hypothetical protein ACKWRH_37200 [Bradyrhizobium sp. Pa8]|uniref:hypothetical protein n=1 Tax=Bradyrhizobium sp. Pa8 TaxID=3386552 RepID=UPI00403F7EFF